MIKSYVNQSEFVDALTRTYDNTNFSYDGKVALYDYLLQLSDDIGEDIELDTIALCCKYTEYDTFEDLQKDYPNVKDLEDLSDYTIVIPVDNAMKTDAFIIQNF